MNEAGGSGFTALIFASHEGHSGIVRLLLAAGAKVGQANHGGRAPLIFSGENGHQEAMTLLLDQGADVY